MRKLVWQNSLGDEINLTKAPFGIINWEGFSNAPLNIQSQQVPMQDGSVFLDALIENRDLNVTLSIQDGNDLEKRYELERQLIHILNPKLGEGYLIYTNDFISKRIKCIPQIPLFPNKNSNDPGTQKGELAWTACEPYWEDLEEKEISFGLGEVPTVMNEGDISAQVKLEFLSEKVQDPEIINTTNLKKIKLNGNQTSNIYINTNPGQKSVVAKNFDYEISEFGGNMKSVCFSEKLFMYLTIAQGMVKFSYDGENWEIRKSNLSININKVIWVNTLENFFAVGYDENNKGIIYSSSDGFDWEVNLTGNYSRLNSIFYSQIINKLIAVGDSGTILTSSDGLTWESHNVDFNDIIYDKELKLFVAFKSLGNDDYVGLSSDCVNWTTVTLDVPSFVTLQSIMYNYLQNKLIIVGDYGIILSSEDGSNWENNYGRIKNFLLCVTYISELSLFFALGGSRRILKSNDGLTWESVYYEAGFAIFDVCYSKTQNKIVAVCNDQSENSMILYSLDGGVTWNYANWNSQDANKRRCLLRAITYNKELNIFITVGGTFSNDYGFAYFSADGIEWNGVIGMNMNGGLVDVKYIEDLKKVVVVSDKGRVFTSPNGVTNWTYSDIGSVTQITSFTYSSEDKKIIVHRLFDKIYISKDFINWEEIETGYTKATNEIIYIKELNLFLILTQDDYLGTSSDGVNWQFSKIPGAKVQNAHYSKELDSIIFVGYEGLILYSVYKTSENKIQMLSPDSDLNFNLDIGENTLRLAKSSGDLLVRMKYRQKYIGV